MGLDWTVVASSRGLSRWAFAALLPLTAHCGPAEPPAELVATGSSAIAEGYEDAESVAVVSILNVNWGLLCSGSLIERNVVLTARHCVAPSNTSSGVVCSNASFSSSASPESFSVSTDAVLDVEKPGLGVSAVLVPDDPEFCGGDVAVLVLEEPVPETIAAPLLPRLDEPIVAGEAYYAVGFGGIDDGGSEAGTRRRRDDLVVACVGTACNEPEAPEVYATEFRGETGVCIGDSGGPAMDLEDRVIGVTSRGLAGCDAPVYGSTVQLASFIQDSAVYAAGAGEYEPPAWTAGSTVDPHASAPVGAACATSDDCYTGLCVDGSAGKFCSRPCDDTEAPCPTGLFCLEQGHCGEPPPPKHTFPSGDREDDGCRVGAAGATRASSTAAWLVTLASLGLWRRRLGPRRPASSPARRA